MKCSVWRSAKKSGAYLYLAEAHEWQDLPAELQQLLGECERVMELNLAELQKLATEDIRAVKTNLATQGFHLQLPPRHATGVIHYGSQS